uniref:Dynein regulatory complex protein 10 n=1 Tax=Strigamia maritima TaxID=126957 RepID=T1IZK9_STRMM
MSKLPKIQSSSLDLTCSTRSKGSVRRKSSTSPQKMRMESELTQKLAAERRKLVSIERQRIIAVMDDALYAIQIVSRFAAVCENYEYFENFLGPEIASAFQHLCTTLNYPIDSQSTFDQQKSAEADAIFLVSLKDMTKSKKLGMYSTPAMKRIIGVVKNLIRLIFANRKVFNSLQMDSQPSPTMFNFLETMQELREFVFERLQTTDATEREHMLFLENSLQRERVLQEQIEELDGELSRVKTMDSYQYAEQEGKLSMETQVTLNSEYQASLKQYDALVDNHRRAEVKLRKKNFKMNVEVDNWIKKYDKDMNDRLVALETLGSEYIEEEKKLAKLEEKFAPVEEEYKALLAERIVNEQKRLDKMVREPEKKHIFLLKIPPK